MAESKPASMLSGGAPRADHARESLPRSQTSSQQDAITALIEQWREMSAVNERLRTEAPLQAWEMIYMDRRDIFARCADQLAALQADHVAAISSHRTAQEPTT